MGASKTMKSMKIKYSKIFGYTVYTQKWFQTDNKQFVLALKCDIDENVINVSHQLATKLFLPFHHQVLYQW